jgi:tetratricopeptide (TPR) repeat protein
VNRFSSISAALRALKFPPRLAQLLSTNWLRALLLLVISVLVRAPSLSGEFIWDDGFLARDSPFIKSPLLALEVFRQHLFPDSFSAHYRPVQNVSFIVDYFFWNTNTFGFHFTNLLLHGGSAVALFFLLQRLLRSALKADWLGEKSSFISGLAFFGALLWAVHPVHSAAVDYISGRADSLAFLFAATGWVLVFRAREQKPGFARHLLFLAVALLGLLALCSRETACIWFLLFLVHTLFFDRQVSRRGKTLAVTVCVILFAGYLGLRQLPPPRSGAGPSQGWGAPVRSVLMLRALGDYARLIVFPANLHMERTVVNPENYLNSSSWQHSVATEYLSILGMLFAALLLAGCRWRGHGRAMRIFGAVWFTLGYLPISNIVELNATCAEHWLYLPSVGILIFLAGCLLELPARHHRSLAALACLAAGALGIRSAVRSSDWTTPGIFYQRTIAAGGNSMRVSQNLAEIYARRGDLARAEALLRKVLAVTPEFPAARNTLARILLEEGKKREAEALFAASVKQSAETSKTYPRTWLAVINLAHLLHSTHRDAEALTALEKARADYPEIWEIVSLESELLRQTKGPAGALRLVSDFAHEHWWHYGAALALGRLYAGAGDAERAVTVLRNASWLDVHEVEALNLIAQMRFRQHRFEEAYRAQKRAVARQPGALRQYVFLSDILVKLGQTAEAKSVTAEVARLEAMGRNSQALAN